MKAKKRVLVAGILGMLMGSAAVADSGCSIRQITDSVFSDRGVFDPDVSRGSVVFSSRGNFTGLNEEQHVEVFLYDGHGITQITDSDGTPIFAAQLDEGLVAFPSGRDITGDNPDRRDQVFLYDGTKIVQVTQDGFQSFSLDGGRIAFASFVGGAFIFDGHQVAQVTEVNLGVESLSLDGSSIAFESRKDLTGENPDGSLEIFVLESGEIRQISNSPAHDRRSETPSMDSGSIAFRSTANLTGRNRDANEEIYLYDGETIIQITDSSPPHGSRRPNLDDGRIAFESTADLTGENDDHNEEIFLYDGSSVIQVTRSTQVSNRQPTLDGQWLAFLSRDDIVGQNPDLTDEVFLASCPPDPPPGPYLESERIKGFRFKVRITAGNEVFDGAQLDDCIGETLCVSGALSGRSELFFRITGPRPNGFLWANLVRFTLARVEVWVEQTGTGMVNYYDLPALDRGDAELTGLVDMEAFSPQDSSGSHPTLVQPRRTGVPEFVSIDTGQRLIRSGEVAPKAENRPRTAAFISEAFPGFRFMVRIFSGETEQPVQLESDCIPETVCVSGALPGRSELFLRLIGPRPNGFLWANLVRFTTSRVEVEIEQLATGEKRTYVLPEVPRGSDELPGRVDRRAFSP